MSKIININKKLKAKRSNDDYNKYAERKQKCLNKIMSEGVCGCSVCTLQRNLIKDIVSYSTDSAVNYSTLTGVEFYWADLVESLMIAAASIQMRVEGNDSDPHPPAG